MNNKTCCFTGHRDIPQTEYINIYEKTKREIINLINKGVEYFIVGGAVGFDTLAATILFDLKQSFSNIKIIVAVPYKAQAKYFSKKDFIIYNEILSLADQTVILSENYYRGCLHNRNRFMVDKSSYIISYLRKTSGGTFYTTDYARKKGLQIIDV